MTGCLISLLTYIHNSAGKNMTSVVFKICLLIWVKWLHCVSAWAGLAGRVLTEFGKLASLRDV